MELHCAQGEEEFTVMLCSKDLLFFLEVIQSVILRQQTEAIAYPVSSNLPSLLQLSQGMLPINSFIRDTSPL